MIKHTQRSVRNSHLDIRLQFLDIFASSPWLFDVLSQFIHELPYLLVPSLLLTPAFQKTWPGHETPLADVNSLADGQFQKGYRLRFV